MNAAADTDLQARRAAYRHDRARCLELARSVGITVTPETFNARVDYLTEPGPALDRPRALCHTAAELRAQLVEAETAALEAMRGETSLEAAARYCDTLAPVVRDVLGL